MLASTSAPAAIARSPLRVQSLPALRPATQCSAQGEGSSLVEGLGASVAKGLCAALCAGLVLTGGAYAKVAETTTPGSNLGFLSDEEVSERRIELGFLRAFDGKVALQSPKTRSFWDVKLDLKSPGTLLLRSPDGAVHILAYETLKQIDLSDDEVVGAIASGPWETGAKPVEATDDNDKLQKLELTREGFFELMSVVDP